jgi:hypothetical protein
MWFSSDEYYIGRPPFSSTRRGVAHLCTFPPSGWVFGACTARHRSPRRSWLKPGVERFQAAGRGLPQKVWQVSPQKVWQVKGLADVSPERSGRCLPRKVWRMSPQKGLADVSPERSGGCLPRKVWRMSPQKVWQGSAAEALAVTCREALAVTCQGLTLRGS